MRESSTSVVLFGAGGRMGARVAAIALNDRRFELRACVSRSGAAPSAAVIAGAAGPARADEARVSVAAKTVENALKTPLSCDVVIDFSSPQGTPIALEIAARAGAALLVGTTGLSPALVENLRAASASRAVLVAPNTSLGICVMASLARAAAAALGPGYECSIVEAHHSKKKDAPSGTALRLAAAVRGAGHEVRDDQILAVRGGDVVGEHTVRFAGEGEYLELTHRATTRDLFACGALTCAAWLKGKPAGWYTVEDVVNMPA